MQEIILPTQKLDFYFLLPCNVVFLIFPIYTTFQLEIIIINFVATIQLTYKT